MYNTGVFFTQDVYENVLVTPKLVNGVTCDNNSKVTFIYEDLVADIFFIGLS